MNRVLCAALVLGALGLLARSPIAAQSSPATQQPRTPTFSTLVEYVEVEARVVDGRGNPVRNLPKDAFRLLEDGKEQTIETFLAIDVPVEATTSASTTTTPASRDAAGLARVEPDIVLNRQSAENSRLLVVILDDRQIDAHRTQMTIRVVTEFIREHLGSNDLAAVVSTSGRTDVSQALTTNKDALLKSVSGFMGRKIESAALLSLDGLNSPLVEQERIFDARASLQALGTVVRWMSGINGRNKAVLLVSEGPGANTDAVMSVTGGPDASSLLDDEREILAAAVRANVTVYPLDPRGLFAYDELITMGAGMAAGVAEARAVASLRESGASAGGRPAVGLDSQSRAARAFKAEVQRSQMSLRLIAAETGADIPIGTNNYQNVFTRIIGQQSTYYLLGYYPSNPRHDGRFRNISVRVAPGGLRVIARRGYREASDKTSRSPAPAPNPSLFSPDAREALGNALPFGDLPLAVTAVALKGEHASGSIAVVVEAPADAITGAPAGSVPAVETIVTVIDQHNKQVASQAGTTSFKTANGVNPLQRGFRFVAGLTDIKPGRYQVRVAVAIPSSSTRGSVWQDVEVPDFSKREFAVSGIVVASVSTGAVPTMNPAKLFTDILPVPPTTSRRFENHDELTALVEVWADRETLSDGADLVFTVVADGGEAVMRRTSPISADAFRSGNGATRFAGEFPLVNLAAGRYVLRVEATSRGGKRVSRALPFEVVRPSPSP